MSRCRILLLGPHLTRNFGGPSVVLGIMRALGEQLEGCQFLLANSGDEAERSAAQKHGVSLVPLRGVTNSPNRTLLSAAVAAVTGRPLVGSAPIRELIRTVQAADLVVGGMGIMFADSLGGNGFRRRFFEGYLFGIAKALGKPTIQYTADFGPLNARWNRFFAKFWLGRCLDAVICRSNTSHGWLTRIGIAADKLFVAPDTGILMKPQPSEEASRIEGTWDGAPSVAIGVSHQIRNRVSDPAEYDSTIGCLVRHVARKRNYRVLVVPNELRDRPEVDDGSIAQTIVEQADDRRVSMVDTARFSGPELKAVLGQCRVVVSSRYHSLVAGLSMGVPCMALAWHHKYLELFRLFGMDEWVFDYRNCGKQALVRAFDELSAKQDGLRRRICDHLPSVKSAIRDTAAAVVKRIAPRWPRHVKLRESACGHSAPALETVPDVLDNARSGDRVKAQVTSKES